MQLHLTEPSNTNASAHSFMPRRFEQTEETPASVPPPEPTRISTTDIQRSADGLLHCPECDFAADVKQAIGAHRFRKHSSPEVLAAFNEKLAASQRVANAARQEAKAEPVEKTRKLPSHKRVLIDDDLHALVEALPAVNRARLLHRRAGFARRGGDIGAWEADNLKELLANDNRPATAATVVENAATQLRIAEKKERDERRAADALFVKVAAATDALFPDRVSSDRILEVAEWQRATVQNLP